MGNGKAEKRKQKAEKGMEKRKRERATGNQNEEWGMKFIFCPFYVFFHRTSIFLFVQKLD